MVSGLKVILILAYVLFVTFVSFLVGKYFGTTAQFVLMPFVFIGAYLIGQL